MSDLSTTAATNSPAGSENPSNGDDFLRAIQAIVRTTNAKGADIASAATTDIGAATGEFVDVTGTTTITALGTIAAGIARTVRFTGALTLTHNATSLILPGSANITTANGDCAIFRSLGSGNWKCIAYQTASGSPVIGSFVDSSFRVVGSSDATKKIAFEADTNITTATTVTATAQNRNGTMALVEGQIQPITATVGSSAMTITLNPTSLAFRSSTLGSGTVNVRAVNAAITTVISSGSTGGTTSANLSRLAILAIDNAGTVELAWCNTSGSVLLDEGTLISTTAEGGAGAADSASVIYSTTARSNVPFRIVGYVESTQATAGTWATAPSTIQGYGGAIKTQNIVNGATITTTSGTSQDFTVPAWVKKITLMFSGVSTNGTSIPIVQIGDAGGIEATGYLGSISTIANTSTAGANNTIGFYFSSSSSAATVYHGILTLALTDAATNTWSSSGVIGSSNTAANHQQASSKALSAILTTVRLTTVNGTDTFDAGLFNILYE